MSNHLISMAYKRDLRTAMRKAVMVLLADKASDDGSGIWASKQTMADELCCSKQAVIQTIQAFIAEGLVVEIGKRRSPNGFTVEYGISVEALAAVPMVKCHTDQSTRLTGQRDSPVNGVDVTGQRGGPKPSLTPHEEEEDASAIRTPQDFLDAWNDMAARCNARGAEKLTEKRRKAAKARIDEYTEAIIREAIAAVPFKPWLMGINDRRWRADFDWILRPDSITRLREGKYDHVQPFRPANDPARGTAANILGRIRADDAASGIA